MFTCSLNLLPAELGHFPESRWENEAFHYMFADGADYTEAPNGCIYM